MNSFLGNVLGFVLRVGLWLAGLVFFVSLLAVGTLIFLLWLLRMLWARLTGQPVQPWTFRVDRQAVWQRFYRAAADRGRARRDGVIDADVVDADVSDVEPKRIDRPDR